jgi:hypothetical protein
MCDRRFLLIVFFLILLAVGGAFAFHQWGTDVLIRQAVPKGRFEAAEAGSGSDYARLESWLAHPGLADDPSRWLPERFEDTRDAGAAVFYIHPTTYLLRDRWNAPLSGTPGSEYRAALFVRSQASAFNGVGQVWAPRYRQAAYGAFLLKSEDAQQALDLAFGDVRAAFDHFLKQVPAGRPIVLAGHSQGALQLSRLLQERGPQLGDRLAAAYVVGWPLSVAADLPPMGLAACAAPEQAGCVLSWQSFGEPGNPDLVLDAWQGSEGPGGVERKREDMLCVNPLTGTAGGAALPQANPGTLVPTPDLASGTLVPGQVGARCEDGFLTLFGDIPPLGPYVLPGNNYHVFDYALFWAAVRRDAERRVAAWRRR